MRVNSARSASSRWPKKRSASARRAARSRGHRFSGGEKQRLAIARTLLRDPRILVLDHGRVVEAGDHDSLLDRNGRYATLAA